MKRLAIAEPAVNVGSIPGTGTIDQHVSQRIRRRRILLGLTQQQLAELIGVTYQQAHKYEKGINRISSGRLYQIAEALGVEISYFFAGAEPDHVEQPVTRQLVPQQRMLLELARNFSSLKRREHQEVICHLARALIHRD